MRNLFLVHQRPFCRKTWCEVWPFLKDLIIGTSLAFRTHPVWVSAGNYKYCGAAIRFEYALMWRYANCGCCRSVIFIFHSGRILAMIKLTAEWLCPSLRMLLSSTAQLVWITFGRVVRMITVFQQFCLPKIQFLISICFSAC